MRSVRRTIRTLEEKGVLIDAMYDHVVSEFSRLTGIDWEEVPISVREFVENPEYTDFGEFTWPYVMDECESIVGGHEKGAVREAVLEWSIGTGKSTLASILGLYFVYRLLCMRSPQRQFKIAPDDHIAVMNMARNAQQAKKIVFDKISARVKMSPWFQKRGYMPDPDVTSELRFPKGVVCIPGNSSQTFPLGYNIIVAVLDEANFYEDLSGKDNAEQVYDSMQRRVTSRFPKHGLIVAISSTTHDLSFTRKKEQEAVEEPSVYVSQRTIMDKPELGPTVVFKHRGNIYDVPAGLIPQYRRNPDKALRDYHNIAAAGDTPYMPPYTWLTEHASTFQNSWDDVTLWPPTNFRPVIMQGGQPSRDSRPRFVHVDLALRKDAAGIAVAYVSSQKTVGDETRPVVRLELVARIKPAQMGGEIDFAQIRRIVYELANRGFNIAHVTYDGFASEESIQQLQRRGFSVDLLSVDKTMLPYETFKEALYEERLEYPTYEPLLREVSRLQNPRGMKVDHPQGGSKDVADAAAGAVYMAVAGGGGGNAVSWVG